MDNLQFLHCLQPSEVTSELQSLLSNEHIRQLMISHDLISSQIYQSPTLRLYPSGKNFSYIYFELRTKNWQLNST